MSADLDRELQGLDVRRLQAHLRVCAECSVWAENVKATTTQLREAPFEAPPATAVELPRRGRARRLGAALAVAPAAALVAGAAVFLGAAQHGMFSNQRTTRTSQYPADRSFVRYGPDVDMYRLPALHGPFRAL